MFLFIPARLLVFEFEYQHVINLSCGAERDLHGEIILSVCGKNITWMLSHLTPVILLIV